MARVRRETEIEGETEKDGREEDYEMKEKDERRSVTYIDPPFPPVASPQVQFY